MTLPREFLDYLDDIRDAVTKAWQFVAGMTYEQFAADEKTGFAVIRCLEIVGEATRKTPRPFAAGIRVSRGARWRACGTF